MQWYGQSDGFKSTIVMQVPNIYLIHFDYVNVSLQKKLNFHLGHKQTLNY